MSDVPSEKSLEKMRRFVTAYCAKTGTTTHPMPEVTEGVVEGLARHLEQLGRPLCPCRFYPDKEAELKQRTWVCACEDMKVYKYCHCLLFTNADGMPITEHLPEDHEGREVYGLVEDPTPEKGRERRQHADARERDRSERPS